MLLPLKPILDGRPRKKGVCPIYIQYCHSTDKRTELKTGIAIPPQFWKENRKKKTWKILPDLPQQFGSPDDLRERITKMLRIAEDIITYARKKNVKNVIEFLQLFFDPFFDTSRLPEMSRKNTPPEKGRPAHELCLYGEFDDYIETKSKTVSEAMVKVYRVIKGRLQAFQEHRHELITFECFNIDFYEEFVNYLSYDHLHVRKKKPEKGLKRSTIGTTVKQLRIFLNDRIRRQIIPPIDLTGFKILDEESDAIYLTMAEIINIYELDLSEYPYLEKYRYLLVLGCLTGLRFSDFSQIKPEDIRKRKLYKKQQKTRGWVIIPLRDRANYILHYIFKKRVPDVTEGKFNKYIKVIGMLAGLTEKIKFSYQKGNKTIEVVKPKYEWITSHTCRRSFCTNEFLAGTPTALIMKISGHRSMRDFLKYIRITAEEASQMMHDLWVERGEIQAA